MLELLEKYRGKLVEIKVTNIETRKKPFVVVPLSYLDEDYPSYLVEDAEDNEILIEVREDALEHVKPIDTGGDEDAKI